MSTGSTLATLVADLDAERTSSAELVQACLEKIADPEGEGRRAFVTVDEEPAKGTADAIDALRAAGTECGPYAGIPVSVKDLFDVRGQVTRAGSRVLDRGAATADAPPVARWRQAGLVLVGRTNMTEFAFSGLGINPHFGTPANPWDRERGRIPGGSSSGAAVSVADGMAHGALGSDTGGSCRIPAALCGLVGFKPTQSLVTRAGMVPLSTSLDAVGVVARSVTCCATLTWLSIGEAGHELTPASRRPRLAVPRGYFDLDADPVVLEAFERALERLAAEGAELVEVALPELDEIPESSAQGGFPAAESFAWHRELIERHEDGYDPRVLARIRRGERQSAADLIALHEWRRRLIADVRARLDGFDGFCCPTVPLPAPPLDVFEDDDEYARLNLLMLRNPTVVNLLDGCAISIPMHADGEPPSGLMLAAFAGEDRALLRLAAWVEQRL